MTASSVITEHASPAIRRAVPLLLVALIGAGTVVALGLFAARHLPNIGFWYDETVQFWISLGEDAFTAPLHAPGRLVDAIHFNGFDNLDPGGFTILLHWWMRAGTGAIWLRALPLMFFVIGAAGLALIGWRRYRSVYFALACGLVPALFPLLLDFASEVRAYSMEFAGVVIGCALVDRVALRGARDTLLLAAGTIFACFLSARYAYALFTASAACALLVSCHVRRSRGEPTTRLADLVAMAVPVAAGAVLIAVLALWPQYKARIAYQDGALLHYLANTTAASKSLRDLFGMLAYNLLSPVGVPVTIAAIAGALGLLHMRKALAENSRLDRAGKFIARTDLLPFCLICLAALAVSLLTWRWHPWDLSAKWSLWLQGLSAVAIVQFSGTALASVPPRRAQSIAPALLAIAALLDIRLATYQRPVWPSLVGELARLESLKPAPETVAIDVYDYPTVRYLYEYGPASGGTIYPAAFRFSYYDPAKPLIDKDTRFLISGRSLEAVTKAFAPTRIRSDPELPPHLYRVEVPASPNAANP
jgi:hypothetical protein